MSENLPIVLIKIHRRTGNRNIHTCLRWVEFSRMMIMKARLSKQFLLMREQQLAKKYADTNVTEKSRDEGERGEYDSDNSKSLHDDIHHISLSMRVQKVIWCLRFRMNGMCAPAWSFRDWSSTNNYLAMISTARSIYLLHINATEHPKKIATCSWLVMARASIYEKIETAASKRWAHDLPM